MQTLLAREIIWWDIIVTMLSCSRAKSESSFYVDNEYTGDTEWDRVTVNYTDHHVSKHGA